jgi:hypothetical protein
MASYFSPRTIIAYLNDTGYEVPQRDPAFLAQLNIFDDEPGMEAFFDNLPEPRGNADFFHQMYGSVDGKEIERFARLSNWPTEKAVVTGNEAEEALRWRDYLTKATAQANILVQQAIERQKIEPVDDENYIDECKLALGIDATFQLRQDDATNGTFISKAVTGPHANIVVMSINLWHGGEAHPEKPGLEAFAKLILANKADVVGAQEVAGQPDADGKRNSNLAKLADHLSRLDNRPWKSIDQGILTPGKGNIQPWGILSRLPIVAQSPAKFGACFQVEKARVWLFNTHLAYFPYQPYQVVGIPYEGAPPLLTEEAVVASSLECRGKQVQALIEDMRGISDVIFVAGDFNEPSHLDWTCNTVLGGIQPISCRWPSTFALAQAGFTDVYRLCHPDEVAKPAFTWSPRKTIDSEGEGQQADARPTEHHDRIDFLMINGASTGRVEIEKCMTIGPRLTAADRTVDYGLQDECVAKSPKDYPTDHRIVVANIKLAL